jgi:hypothetical protein
MRKRKKGRKKQISVTHSDRMYLLQSILTYCGAPCVTATLFPGLEQSELKSSLIFLFFKFFYWQSENLIYTHFL